MGLSMKRVDVYRAILVDFLFSTNLHLCSISWRFACTMQVRQLDVFVEEPVN